MDQIGKLPSVEEQIDLERFFYKGKIYQQQKKFQLAKKFCKKALEYTRRHKSFRFIDSLKLNYCASLLYDVDSPLSVQTMLSIQKNLENIDAKLCPKNLYEETKARYYLRAALQERETLQIKKMARKSLLHCKKYLQCGDSALVYYVRARAYQLLGNYHLALKNFKMCSKRNPHLIPSISGHLECLISAKRTWDFANHEKDTLSSIIKATQLNINLYSEEFSRLKSKYSAKKHSFVCHPFHEEKLSLYCKNLSQKKSLALQNLAKNAIVSMESHNSVLKKIKAKISDPKAISEIEKLIKKRQKEKEKFEFLEFLSRTPARGKIFHLEYFDNKKAKRLMQIFNDSDESILLRYLAVKILAQHPNIGMRMKLSKFLWRVVKKPQEIINQFLIIKTFQEIGYDVATLDPDLIYALWKKTIPQLGSIKNQDESSFLLSIIAQVLPKFQYKSTQVLNEILLLKNAKTQLMAATQYPLKAIARDLKRKRIHKTLKLLFTLRKHHNQNIAALSLATLSNYFVSLQKYRLLRGHVRQITKSLIPLMKNAKEKSLLQRSILYFWQNCVPLLRASKYLKEKDYQQILKAIRPLWESSNILLKYQSIFASARLYDVKKLQEMLLSKSKNLLERMTFIGIFMNFKAKKVGGFLAKNFPKLFANRDWQMRGYLLYMMSRYLNADFRELPFAKTFKRFMWKKTIKSLDDPHPFVRVLAALSISNMYNLGIAKKKANQGFI